MALDGMPGGHALTADTDGVNDMEETAGSLVRPDTLAPAWALCIHPRAHLDDNDGHRFFQASGDSLITGSARTNGIDFRAVMIDAA